MEITGSPLIACEVHRPMHSREHSSLLQSAMQLLRNTRSLYSRNVTTRVVVNFGRSRATPSDFSSGREVEEDEARTIRQGNIHFYNSFLYPAPATANPSLDGDISEF